MCIIDVLVVCGGETIRLCDTYIKGFLRYI